MHKVSARASVRVRARVRRRRTVRRGGPQTRAREAERERSFKCHFQSLVFRRGCPRIGQLPVTWRSAFCTVINARVIGLRVSAVLPFLTAADERALNGEISAHLDFPRLISFGTCFSEAVFPRITTRSKMTKHAQSNTRSATRNFVGSALRIPLAKQGFSVEEKSRMAAPPPPTPSPVVEGIARQA